MLDIALLQCCGSFLMFPNGQAGKLNSMHFIATVDINVYFKVAHY